MAGSLAEKTSLEFQESARVYFVEMNRFRSTDAIRIQTGLFPVTVRPRPTFGEPRRPWRG